MGREEECGLMASTTAPQQGRSLPDPSPPSNHLPDAERVPGFSVVVLTLNEEADIAECIERVEDAVAELGVPGSNMP
jgi:hypothetical protein